MTTTAKYRDLARQVHVDLGGRAAIAKVREEFIARLDPDEAHLLGLVRLDHYVATLLRGRNGAEELPWALSNGEEYVQRSLLTLEERTDLIRRYVRQSNELRHRAFLLAVETKDIYGVWIDPETGTGTDGES